MRISLSLLLSFCGVFLLAVVSLTPASATRHLLTSCRVHETSDEIALDKALAEIHTKAKSSELTGAQREQVNALLARLGARESALEAEEQSWLAQCNQALQRTISYKKRLGAFNTEASSYKHQVADFNARCKGK